MFVGDVVLVALSGDAAVGCAFASGLICAALAQAVESGVGVARLSEWRAGAIALYERFGFAVAESWDVRDQLVCVQRAV